MVIAHLQRFTEPGPESPGFVEARVQIDCHSFPLTTDFNAPKQNLNMFPYDPEGAAGVKYC
jgi:hypothetical protein